MPKILVIEDDENLARGLEINLAKDGYTVLRRAVAKPQSRSPSARRLT